MTVTVFRAVLERSNPLIVFTNHSPKRLLIFVWFVTPHHYDVVTQLTHVAVVRVVGCRYQANIESTIAGRCCEYWLVHVVTRTDSFSNTSFCAMMFL